MNIIVVCVTGIITFVTLGGVILLIQRKKLYEEAEVICSQIIYLLLLGISFLTAITIFELLKVDPFISTVLWFVIIVLVNRFADWKCILPTNEDVKSLLLLGAFILCLIYFGTSACLTKHNIYCEMIKYTLTLIMGFYIPFDVILSKEPLKKKMQEIKRGTGINSKKKEMVYLYLFLCVLLIAYLKFENCKFVKENERNFMIGFIIGMFLIYLVCCHFYKKNK